ncbi:MAG: hypothetical protein HYR96_10595 [Deltaproteobacteria bacterium]|nr:hypothetical protein [Deltaproteobacteria bacterium]MBI3294889.1 hypothetical protein [Deltaproteobacteria bacterium]
MINRLFGRKGPQAILADLYSMRGVDHLVGLIESECLRVVPLDEAVRGKGTAIILSTARKGTLVQVCPSLEQRALPATVMVSVDRVGLNALSLEDERALYSLARPDATTTDPAALRRILGPLPLDRINPLIFPAMWRDLSKLTATLFVLGCDARDAEDPTTAIEDFGHRAGRSPGYVWTKDWEAGESAIAVNGRHTLSCRRINEGFELWPE